MTLGKKANIAADCFDFFTSPDTKKETLNTSITEIKLIIIPNDSKTSGLLPKILYKIERNQVKVYAVKSELKEVKKSKIGSLA